MSGGTESLFSQPADRLAAQLVRIEAKLDAAETRLDRLDVKLDSVTDRIENKLDVVVTRTDLRIDRLADRMFPLWRAFRAALAAVLVLYIVFALALRWMPPSVSATDVWWLFVWPVVVAGTLGGGALWFVRRL